MQAPYVLLRMSLFPNKLKEANVLQSRPRTPTPACLPACLLCCALSGVRRMGVWVVEAAGCPVRWWPAHF